MGSGSYERQLVNALTESGYPAMRAPSSGSATDRELPDVLFGKAHILSGSSGPIKTLSDAFAVELKSGQATTLYLDGEEAHQLGAFSQAFGATPCAGAKFKRPGGSRSPIYIVPLKDCRKTDGGNYGVPESDAEERAVFLVYPATENKPAEVEYRG